jgi:AraC-like DNA-binding protein
MSQTTCRFRSSPNDYLAIGQLTVLRMHSTVRDHADKHMTHTYIRHIPSPPLGAYIDYLYYCDGLIYPREKMLPMATVHLVISFGGAVKVFDGSGAKPYATFAESWVIGVWSECHIAEGRSNIRFFGVCFKPGAAYPFLQLPLSELHNQFVSLEAIWGDYAVEIRERLYTAPTIQAGFDRLEQLLLARLAQAPHRLKVVRYSVAEIARQHGALSIRALSDHIGISQNHLLTQFKRMVGVSPKELAGLYRLEHVLRTIDPTKPVDWTLIAQQSGYYDQAHFNKDFMTHLGHTPTDYLRLRRRVQAENPEHDRLLRTLPID